MSDITSEAEFFLGSISCDSCNSSAKLMMKCPDGEHHLALCQHHANRYVLNLLIQRWTVLHDQREWKAEGAASEVPVPAS